MAQPLETRKPATYADLLGAPENMVAELIDGELHLQPRPAKRHVMAASRLFSLLGPPFDLGRGGPGGWRILFEPELHLGADVLVPDIAGWRTRDTPHFDLEVAHFEERPSWVCEVLSPRTARHDRLTKLGVYHAAGVASAWLVDPRERIVEVYEHTDKGWLRVATADGDGAASLPPFTDVPLELALIWPPEQ